MTNLSVERMFRAVLGRTWLGVAKAASALVGPSEISAAPRVDPLIFASPAKAADARTNSAPRAVSLDGTSSAARGPLRTFFGEALAGAGAFALLAAALGLGADAARSEPNALAETSTLAWADPLYWGSSPEPARATKIVSPVEVSLDAIRQSCAADDSPWMRFGRVLPGAGAFALLAAALEAIRRQRRRRKLRLQTLFEVREAGDERLEAAAPSAEVQAPRFLRSNPYLDSARPHWLGRQIENAAEASLEFGRVLGVVFFDIGDPPPGEEGGAATHWTEAAQELVFTLQGSLRPTDHVALLDDRYLVVCIALLPGKTELIGIGERVRCLGQASPTFAAAFARQPGLSMFPLCGYRGEELLAFARTNFYVRNSLVPARLPRSAGEFEPARQDQG